MVYIVLNDPLITDKTAMRDCNVMMAGENNKLH